jgi:hypothetical protein
MSSKDIFVADSNEYQKCAPSKQYSNGSCFTIDSLKKIANAYNNYMGEDHNKKITIGNSKQKLVEELTDRISQCKGDQLCWLDVDWIKKIKDIDIHKNTFRPKGPQGRFKWLSTTNINDIAKQYEDKYSDFSFLGAVPYDFEELDQLGIGNMNLDELTDQGKFKIGLVINMDEHWKQGSHWVGLYADLKQNQIFYFDSYGLKPKKRICKYVGKLALWCYKRHTLNIQKGGQDDDKYLDTETLFMKSNPNKYEKELNINYNRKRHQFKSSECGIYSVNFILRLLNGETFDNICNNVTVDDMVNQCRKVYFRFK